MLKKSLTIIPRTGALPEQMGGMGTGRVSVILLQHEYTFLPLIVWPLASCWSFLRWSVNEERPGKTDVKIK